MVKLEQNWHKHEGEDRPRQQGAFAGWKCAAIHCGEKIAETAHQGNGELK
jgi:hypothetical protein